jgi:hypothetical protein
MSTCTLTGPFASASRIRDAARHDALKPKESIAAS